MRTWWRMRAWRIFLDFIERFLNMKALPRLFWFCSAPLLLFLRGYVSYKLLRMYRIYPKKKRKTVGERKKRTLLFSTPPYPISQFFFSALFFLTKMRRSRRQRRKQWKRPWQACSGVWCLFTTTTLGFLSFQYSFFLLSFCFCFIGYVVYRREKKNIEEVVDDRVKSYGVGIA